MSQPTAAKAPAAEQTKTPTAEQTKVAPAPAEPALLDGATFPVGTTHVSVGGHEYEIDPETGAPVKQLS